MIPISFFFRWETRVKTKNCAQISIEQFSSAIVDYCNFTFHFEIYDYVLPFQDLCCVCALWVVHGYWYSCRNIYGTPHILFSFFCVFILYFGTYDKLHIIVPLIVIKMVIILSGNGCIQYLNWDKLVSRRLYSLRCFFIFFHCVYSHSPDKFVSLFVSLFLFVFRCS